jgi:hypothetical protein
MATVMLSSKHSDKKVQNNTLADKTETNADKIIDEVEEKENMYFEALQKTTEQRDEKDGGGTGAIPLFEEREGAEERDTEMQSIHSDMVVDTGGDIGHECEAELDHWAIYRDPDANEEGEVEQELFSGSNDHCGLDCLKSSSRSSLHSVSVDITTNSSPVKADFSPMPMTITIAMSSPSHDDHWTLGEAGYWISSSNHFKNPMHITAVSPSSSLHELHAIKRFPTEINSEGSESKSSSIKKSVPVYVNPNALILPRRSLSLSLESNNSSKSLLLQPVEVAMVLAPDGNAHPKKCSSFDNDTTTDYAISQSQCLTDSYESSLPQEQELDRQSLDQHNQHLQQLRKTMLVSKMTKSMKERSLNSSTQLNVKESVAAEVGIGLDYPHEAMEEEENIASPNNSIILSSDAFHDVADQPAWDCEVEKAKMDINGHDQQNVQIESLNVKAVEEMDSKETNPIMAVQSILTLSSPVSKSEHSRYQKASTSAVVNTSKSTVAPSEQEKFGVVGSDVRLFDDCDEILAEEPNHTNKGHVEIFDAILSVGSGSRRTGDKDCLSNKFDSINLEEVQFEETVAPKDRDSSVAILDQSEATMLVDHSFVISEELIAVSQTPIHCGIAWSAREDEEDESISVEPTRFQQETNFEAPGVQIESTDHGLRMMDIALNVSDVDVVVEIRTASPALPSSYPQSPVPSVTTLPLVHRADTACRTGLASSTTHEQASPAGSCCGCTIF